MSYSQTDSLVESAPAENIALRDSGLRVIQPNKAALYSTLLPGLGQIYNRKFWKLPFVYGALGGATYFAVINYQQAQDFLDGFYELTDPDVTNPRYEGVYSESDLIQLYYQHRRWQDLSIIVGAVFYGLQILDAYVDAHLYYFDISDKLSLRWEPRGIPMAHTGLPAPGLGISISLR